MRRLEFKKDVIYRCIGSNFNNGILACGFMTKPSTEQSQLNFQIGYYSCFLLLSGEGYYFKEESNKIPVKGGDFVQRFPGEFHSTEVVPDGNWLEFFISIGKTTYDYLESLSILPKEPVIKDIGYSNKIISNFTELLKQMKEANDFDLPIICLKAQEVILSLLNYKKVSLTTDPMVQTMEKACSLLSSNLNKDIKLEEIAYALNLSYENFRKHFSKIIGLSPGQYRIKQKIEHAKLMLLSGVPIKETAILTGYSDTYSFTKQFTKSVGISPGRYSKSTKKKKTLD